MNSQLDSLNRWLTLGANVGVFVGLILVAYEIHQSGQDFLVLDSMRGRDDVLAFKDDWRENMSLPAYRDYWSRSENRHTPGFLQLLNDILVELDVQ